MVKPLLPQWEDIHSPVIGMLHLKALPGSPQYGGDRDLIKHSLLQGTECLVDGGVYGLLIENFGDPTLPPAMCPHIHCLAYDNPGSGNPATVAGYPTRDQCVA